MKSNEIEKGDIVSVGFLGAQIALCHSAEVLYIPQATGDSWHFLNIDNGELYYVSEGCTITLVKKREQ